MKALKKILYPLSPILLLAIIILLTKFGRFDYAKQNNKESEYDTIMKDAIATKYNASGEKSIQIKTPLLQHQNKSTFSKLEKPHAIIFNSDNNDWTVTADNGTSNSNTNITTLTGSVIMHHPGNQSSRETYIYTNKVIYSGKTNIAICPDHIKTVEPQYTLNGKVLAAQTMTGDSAIINTKTNDISGKNLKIVKKNIKPS
jgi:LPS export ABC transporter protein LptC